MTTLTIVALRFSPDVEARMVPVQTAIVRDNGVWSARALPPLVPLSLHPIPPDDEELDRVRRSADVAVHAVGGLSNGAAAPWVGLSLRATGIAPLAARTASDESPAESDLAGAVVEAAKRPAVVVAWERLAEGDAHGAIAAASAISVRPTRALWLTSIEVRIEGDDEPWWSGGIATRVVYSRRLRIPAKR